MKRVVRRLRIGAIRFGRGVRRGAVRVVSKSLSGLLIGSLVVFVLWGMPKVLSRGIKGSVGRGKPSRVYRVNRAQWDSLGKLRQHVRDLEEGAAGPLRRAVCGVREGVF